MAKKAKAKIKTIPRTFRLRPIFLNILEDLIREEIKGEVIDDYRSFFPFLFNSSKKRTQKDCLEAMMVTFLHVTMMKQIDPELMRWIDNSSSPIDKTFFVWQSLRSALRGEKGYSFVKNEAGQVIEIQRPHLTKPQKTITLPTGRMSPNRHLKQHRKQQQDLCIFRWQTISVFRLHLDFGSDTSSM